MGTAATLIVAGAVILLIVVCWPGRGGNGE